MKNYLSRCLLPLLITFPCFGASMNATIVGNQVQWQQASSKDGYLRPDTWDHFANLPVANFWHPTANQKEHTQLILSNGKQKVSINVPIKGFEYHSPAPFKLAIQARGIASVIQQQSQGFYTIGKGLSADVVELTSPAAPFTKLRPVYHQLDQHIIKAMQQAKLPAGIYRGQLPYNAHYSFKRQGHLAEQPFSGSTSITIDYRPYHLASLQVSGKDELALSYGNGKVSGSTHYDINATGLFANGIAVKLRPAKTASGIYALTGVNGAQGEIPFDLQCETGCEQVNQPLIKAGKAIIDMSNKATLLNQSQTNASARITVSFTDQPLAPLQNGRYQGHFVLIFEENI